VIRPNTMRSSGGFGINFCADSCTGGLLEFFLLKLLITNQQLSGCASLFLSKCFYNTLDCGRQLCAVRSPMSQTVHCDVSTDNAFFNQRVMETQTLDETTIATVTLVSNYDIEKRAIV
jgi:hypothetical protein